MKNSINYISKEKKPLYITTYDKLFELIKNGTFPSESKLPPEIELSKTFGVSRMTLRQALSLLQDDGLVKSVHGKGNFITKMKFKEPSVGLEKISHPIYKCHSEEIDSVEMDFRLELESEYTQSVLGQNAAAIVAFERWYKANESIVAYAFTFMSIETATRMNLDLNNNKDTLDMLERRVYDEANFANIEIKRSASVNASSQRHAVIGGEDCDLILESLYTSHQQAILYNKYYIPHQFSSLKLNLKK